MVGKECSAPTIPCHVSQQGALVRRQKVLTLLMDFCIDADMISLPAALPDVESADCILFADLRNYDDQWLLGFASCSGLVNRDKVFNDSCTFK